jgi:hypothetical protein
MLYPPTQDYARGRELFCRRPSEAGAIMIEQTCMHRDGHEVPCLLPGRPRHERRLDLGVVLTITQITDPRGAEEALRKANDELETRVDERTAELICASEGPGARHARAEASGKRAPDAPGDSRDLGRGLIMFLRATTAPSGAGRTWRAELPGPRLRGARVDHS